VPPRLIACVECALERDPSMRFKSAREMAGELAEVLKTSDPQDHHRQLGQVIIEARQRLGLLGSSALTAPDPADPAEVAVHSVEIEFSQVTRDLIGPKGDK
jgi:hypothetical protein